MAAPVNSAFGEAPSKDEDKDQVIVLLRLHNSSPIPERRLVFTPSRPAVPVGRSSRDRSKGFIPAKDNAWLENPVMSREHAELFVKFDDHPRAVYVKDIDSFHGTYLTSIDGSNQPRPIVPFEPVKLTHGDTIQFGVDIFRSNKSYPPCSVDFLIDMMTLKPVDVPRRCFTVPDDVDDEDDEERENEDDLTITAVHTRSDPVDLTRSWSSPVSPQSLHSKSFSGPTVGSNMVSNVIDLTSEVVTCQSNAEPCAMGQDTPGLRKSNISSPVSVLRVPEDHPGLLARLVHTDDRIIYNHSLQVVSDGEEDYISHDDDDFSDEDAESELGQCSESDAGSRSEFTDQLSPLIDVDELSMNEDETSSEMADEADFSDDYAAPFHDDDIPFCDPFDEESVGEDYSDLDEDEQHGRCESLHDQPHTEAPVLNTNRTNDTEAEPVLLPTPLAAPSVQNQVDTYNPSHGRDPSPSDAALFKRRQPLLDPMAKDKFSLQLEEQDEKLELSAARGLKHAVANQSGSTAPTVAILQTPTNIGTTPPVIGSEDKVTNEAAPVSNASRSISPSLSCTLETKAAVEEMEDSTEATPDASSIKLGDNDTHQYSAWIASGDQFINSPPTDLFLAYQFLRDREQAAPPAERTELDMTSAYTFQQSKLATAAESVSKLRRLPIEDLLAQEPNQCSIASHPGPKDAARNPVTSPHKRSFEEAFDQTEDVAASKYAEHRTTPCSLEANCQDPSSDKHAEVPSLQETIVAVGAHGSPNHGPAVVFVQPEAPRATKRMRLATTAVQVVACVALGSAATFSYLVNTAPVL